MELSLAQQVLADQPFSRLIGARLTAFDEGTATLEIDIEEHHRNQQRFVHGGVLSYAADNVLTFAAGTVLGPGILTRGLTIDYVLPARAGTLRATGTVTHHTARQAVCSATLEMVGPNGAAVCAVAMGTAVLVRRGDWGARDGG